MLRRHAPYQPSEMLICANFSLGRCKPRKFMTGNMPSDSLILGDRLESVGKELQFQRLQMGPEGSNFRDLIGVILIPLDADL